jgi:novobiocin biosynthesis protein NovU/D-mycarose 3-C-methyltransferase
MACRICGAATEEILDLGKTPPANSITDSADVALDTYPLVLEWCGACSNLQLRDCLASDDLYRNYLYVTPKSETLSKHYDYLQNYLVSQHYIDRESFVLEVGSNAGLFLKHIQLGVKKILGIDPAENICKLANEAGIPTICDFFSEESAGKIAKDHGKPDLIVARHCFAHNCNPHPLIVAAASLMGNGAHLVVENAYALNTIENNEFDQIYHEHMFYFSIRSMARLLALHGMKLVDVVMSLVHGGSAIFVAKMGNGAATSESTEQYLARESHFMTREALERFASNARMISGNLRSLISDLQRGGKKIYTYGATAKGNTLLNYVGLDQSTITACVDSTPLKQGKYLPQSGIPIVSEEDGVRNPPDYYLLTAWNYKEEIIAKVRAGGNFHSKFIIPIPFVHIL